VSIPHPSSPQIVLLRVMHNNMDPSPPFQLEFLPSKERVTSDKVPLTPVHDGLTYELQIVGGLIPSSSPVGSSFFEAIVRHHRDFILS
jgi:hypothetical protein